jgi:hypothetical protein
MALSRHADEEACARLRHIGNPAALVGNCDAAIGRGRRDISGGVADVMEDVSLLLADDDLDDEELNSLDGENWEPGRQYDTQKVLANRLQAVDCLAHQLARLENQLADTARSDSSAAARQLDGLSREVSQLQARLLASKLGWQEDPHVSEQQRPATSSGRNSRLHRRCQRRGQPTSDDDDDTDDDASGSSDDGEDARCSEADAPDALPVSNQPPGSAEIHALAQRVAAAEQDLSMQCGPQEDQDGCDDNYTKTPSTECLAFFEDQLNSLEDIFRAFAERMSAAREEVGNAELDDRTLLPPRDLEDPGGSHSRGSAEAETGLGERLPCGSRGGPLRQGPLNAWAVKAT